MTVLTTAGLIYNIEVNVLKIVHFKSFSSKLVKAKIFIL